MILHIGQYAGIPITLDMDLEVNRAIHGLITSQQDELERLKANDFADAIERIKSKELYK